VISPVIKADIPACRFGVFTAVDSLPPTANSVKAFVLLGSRADMLAMRLQPSSCAARARGVSITTQPVEIHRALGDQNK